MIMLLENILKRLFKFLYKFSLIPKIIIGKCFFGKFSSFFFRLLSKVLLKSHVRGL